MHSHSRSALAGESGAAARKAGQALPEDHPVAATPITPKPKRGNGQPSTSAKPKAGNGKPSTSAKPKRGNGKPSTSAKPKRGNGTPTPRSEPLPEAQPETDELTALRQRLAAVEQDLADTAEELADTAEELADTAEDLAYTEADRVALASERTRLSEELDKVLHCLDKAAAQQGPQARQAQVRIGDASAHMALLPLARAVGNSTGKLLDIAERGLPSISRDLQLQVRVSLLGVCPFPDELAKAAMRLRAQLGLIQRAAGRLYSVAGKLDAYAAVLSPIADEHDGPPIASDELPAEST